MKKRNAFVLFFVALATVQSYAQPKAVIEAYIEKYKAIAVAEMQRTGVPASITLAQGIHETGAGTSRLVISSNNHFGIKCKTEWAGERVYHDDDARGECFRKYDDPAISYKDHSDFLRTRSHYAPLFNLDPTDYEAWAYGLKKAGYATNPRYPQILIKLIQDYNLQDYTLIAMGRKEPSALEPVWATASEPVNAAVNGEALLAAPKPVYPQGVFKINDTKVVAVAKGTSYLKVAEEQDISLARLMDFNDMRDGDVALQDGLLYLQRKRKTGARDAHVVTAGETLYDIAQTEGMRLESLLEYNYLTQNVRPAVGEKLYLTTSAPTKPRLANDAPLVVTASFNTATPVIETAVESGVTFHFVEPKETAYSIAKKYNVGVEDLKKWNNMETTDLKIGQQLRINKPRS